MDSGQHKIVMYSCEWSKRCAKSIKDGQTEDGYR